MGHEGEVVDTKRKSGRRESNRHRSERHAGADLRHAGEEGEDRHLNEGDVGERDGEARDEQRPTGAGKEGFAELQQYDYQEDIGDVLLQLEGVAEDRRRGDDQHEAKQLAWRAVGSSGEGREEAEVGREAGQADREIVVAEEGVGQLGEEEEADRRHLHVGQGLEQLAERPRHDVDAQGGLVVPETLVATDHDRHREEQGEDQQAAEGRGEAAGRVWWHGYPVGVTRRRAPVSCLAEGRLRKGRVRPGGGGGVEGSKQGRPAGAGAFRGAEGRGEPVTVRSSCLDPRRDAWGDRTSIAVWESPSPPRSAS